MNKLSLTQRLTMVIASIGALTLAYFALKSHDNPTVKTKSEPSTVAEIKTQPTPSTVETDKTPQPKIRLLTGASIVKITVKKGDTVRFRAQPSSNEEVHIHGYDIMRDIPANKPTLVQFKATLTGVFEIEFEQSKKQIAKLVVEP